MKLRYQYIVVIYNPESGIHQGDIREKLEKSFLRYGMSPEWVQATPSGNYSHVEFHAFDLIVVAGGDGTIHQVVTHMLFQHAKAPLAVIPTGTANLLAHFLQIPSSINRAVDVFLSYPTVKLDVLFVNKQHAFLVALGIGYDALVMGLTRRVFKRIFGFTAYCIGMIQGLFRMREGNFSLLIDGERLERHAKTLFIMNIGQFWKFQLGPNISPQDGKMDLAIVRPVTVLDVLKLFVGLLSRHYFFRGRLEYIPCKHLEIRYNCKMPLQLDGEVMDLGSPIVIEVLPGALEVVSVKTF